VNISMLVKRFYFIICVLSNVLDKFSWLYYIFKRVRFLPEIVTAYYI
jgi:hypothetical protein